MCKSLAIHHTCTHLIPFRLSTCRGTYELPGLKPSRSQPKPGCYSTPTIILASSSPCGSCLQDSIQSSSEKELADVKARHTTEVNGWGMPMLTPEAQTAIAEVEAKLQSETWRLQRLYPSAQFKRFLRPEKGSRVEGLARRESLLRREVLAEEVVEKKWMGLEEELQLVEREKPVEIREYEAGVRAASEALFEEVDGEDEDGRRGTPLSPVVEEQDDFVCEIPDLLTPPALNLNESLAPPDAMRNKENEPPCPQRGPPAPPPASASWLEPVSASASAPASTSASTSASASPSPPPPTNPAVQPPHLRRKAKVTSMRRKAKGQSEELGGEDWFKCMRTGVAVV